MGATIIKKMLEHKIKNTGDEQYSKRSLQVQPIILTQSFGDALSTQNVSISRYAAAGVHMKEETFP